ncbi:hypothetical protein POX_a01861 [Penicillium oxalicum]|uniref:Uncharacterized protein n=1 Tax=Penicillium oxalicum (strain 114-2 / CGMCC 5302) TaxID=933388 RepID=S8BDN9_PENO1|nr:hypothetical protein POX_a01861 [Penicillium oxalicum]EPS33142.1 hypothetical protein PDE_08104 [Penicillium oxalicum 114-2]KAI2795256.1 hypothetical protein POX_a01861 [Penicillium oxalicum]
MSNTRSGSSEGVDWKLLLWLSYKITVKLTCHTGHSYN